MQMQLFAPRPDAPAEAAVRPVIEIRVSPRRRKTVAAHWEGDTIVVVTPQRLPKRDRHVFADELAAKLIQARERVRPSDNDLAARARALSLAYLDGRAVPTSVTWSTRQSTRWGSCTAADGTIRLSTRLRDVPSWVLDAVLVHELAHLLHDDHGRAFKALVARYERSADADVFLAGYSLGLARA